MKLPDGQIAMGYPLYRRYPKSSISLFRYCAKIFLLYSIGETPTAFLNALEKQCIDEYPNVSDILLTEAPSSKSFFALAILSFE